MEPSNEQSTTTSERLKAFDLPVCSTQGCENRGVRTRGCNVCQANLTACSQHLVETFYGCVSVLGDETISKQRELEISTLFGQINIPALLQIASSLNNDLPCIIKPGSTSMMGCCNYHIHLFFPSSAERWLVRIPRLGLARLHENIDVEYLYVSEFATLKFLEGTKVPAPRAFGFDIASNIENDVGVTYLIMEFLEGKPFNPRSASLEEKERVYEGVADILIELSKHPLPVACSLVPPTIDDGEDEPIAGRITTLRSKEMPPFGPFNTAKEYYSTIVETFLKLIEEGKLYSEFGVEAHLTYSILHENISKLLAQAPALEELSGEGERRVEEADEQSAQSEAFYLTHVDPKGDHLLLSPSGHIIGIIDWQGARFSPFAEAFGPSLLTSNVHNLYFGNSGITPDDLLLATALREKGATRLADTMRGSDGVRMFHFGLGSPRIEAELWDIIRALFIALEISTSNNLEDWKKNALERYDGNKRLGL